MSEVPVTTTTLPVAVVYPGEMFISMTVMLAATSLCQTTSGQHDVVLPPQLIPRDMVRSSACLTSMLQQQPPQSQMPYQVYANCAIGPLLVSFSFKVEPPTNSFAMCWYLLWCLLSTSGPHVMTMFSNGGSIIGVYNTATFRIYPWQAYLPPSDGPCQECTEQLLLPLLFVGGVSCCLFSCLPTIHQYGGVYRFGGLAESHLIPNFSLQVVKGSPFPSSAPPNYMVASKSVVGIKPGVSGVAVKYQVDEFTHCQWSALLLEHTFILVSWVRYPH